MPILSDKEDEASQSDTVPPDTPKECLEPASPSAAENTLHRKRAPPSPSSTPPRVGRRPILHSIDNERIEDTSSIPLRSPTFAASSMLLRHDTPSSFLGSPIKKKRRMSSINRL